MSLYDFRVASQLVAQGPSFRGLLMAAMRTADTANLEQLKLAWPDVWVELQDRYHASGGVLPKERMK